MNEWELNCSKIVDNKSCFQFKNIHQLTNAMKTKKNFSSTFHTNIYPLPLLFYHIALHQIQILILKSMQERARIIFRRVIKRNQYITKLPLICHSNLISTFLSKPSFFLIFFIIIILYILYVVHLTSFHEYHHNISIESTLPSFIL